MTETPGPRFAPCASRHIALVIRLLGLVLLVVLVLTSTILLGGIGG